MKIAVATNDLMDRSRITESVPDVEVVFVRTPGALVGLAGVDALVVDLSKRGAHEALAGIVASGLRVIAYGSHVDRATLDAARTAGVTDVLPRSAFFANLRSILGAS
jgi:hypothetical protein